MSLNKGFSEESLKKIAQQKVNFRYSVKIHVAVFILVNTLLLTINLIFTPTVLWVVYPFLGWLIGVVLHIVSFSLWARGVYPMAKRGVLYHLFSFIMVMLLLYVTNYMTLDEISWVIYPTIFWGAGLLAHIVIYYIYFRGGVDKTGEVKSKKQRAIEKEMDKMKKKMKK